MQHHKPAGISRREFVSDAIAAGVLARAPWVFAAGTRRPNVIFILADDLGFGDLSCFGRPDYNTPNLDRLAEEGIRFTNAYSASPVCTPARCAFMTGRYPAKTPVGLQEPLESKKSLGDKAGSLGLSPDHATIASLLKKNGYETALVGKWHLGYLPSFGPIQSGFDEFFGVMSGGVDYFTHKDVAREPDLFEDKLPVKRTGYLTDLLTERAIQYVSRHHSRPFFLSLHYTAPHWPWEGPADGHIGDGPEGLAGFKAGGSLKTYAAMMKSLDDGIGQVMRALGKANLDRDTLVIFTSDNGGERFSYNWPFMGQKGDLHEGGIRVPAIVRWPGMVPPSCLTDQVAITMDWTATILAAAATKPDPNYPLDGRDLLPICKGDGAPYERKLFWRHGRQNAVRDGKWKYLNDGTSEYLFNLSLDHREQADFEDQNPSVLRQLRVDFETWQEQVLPRPESASRVNGRDPGTGSPAPKRVRSL
jgi:arylsulfatase A-like enzyme